MTSRACKSVIFMKIRATTPRGGKNLIRIIKHRVLLALQKVEVQNTKISTESA